MPVIFGATKVWQCPGGRCTTRARTTKPAAPAPSHQCRGLKGLVVPMVPLGTRAEARPVERQDYVGNDVVQTDGEGRPVMAVETVRDEGQDVAVYAPVATAGGEVPRLAGARGAALNPTIRIEERAG